MPTCEMAWSCVFNAAFAQLSLVWTVFSERHVLSYKCMFHYYPTTVSSCISKMPKDKPDRRFKPHKPVEEACFEAWKIRWLELVQHPITMIVTRNQYDSPIAVTAVTKRALYQCKLCTLGGGEETHGPFPRWWYEHFKRDHGLDMFVDKPEDLPFTVVQKKECTM
jgi:hypothetical protein